MIFVLMRFKLNKIELERAKEFERKHKHSEVYKGAIGGHINYIFTPTSIGDACVIHCNICDVEENITDYDSW